MAATIDGQRIVVSEFELEQLIAVVDDDNSESLDLKEVQEMLEHIGLDGAKVGFVALTDPQPAASTCGLSPCSMRLHLSTQDMAESIFVAMNADKNDEIKVLMPVLCLAIMWRSVCLLMLDMMMVVLFPDRRAV